MFDPFGPHPFSVFGTSFRNITPYPRGNFVFYLHFFSKICLFLPSFLKSQIGTGIKKRRLGKAMRKRSKCTDILSREKLNTVALGFPEVKIMCFCLFLPYPGVGDHYQTIRHFISINVTYH